MNKSKKHLYCHGCGEIHLDKPSFVMCECGTVAVRMEWATEEQVEEYMATPETSELAGKIDPSVLEHDAYDTMLQNSIKMERRARKLQRQLDEAKSEIQYHIHK